MEHRLGDLQVRAVASASSIAFVQQPRAYPRVFCRHHEIQICQLLEYTISMQGCYSVLRLPYGLLLLVACYSCLR
jgi:hypothetical protein